MRVGTTLPQFRHDAEVTLARARTAEELGLDGVFVFDHLWPLGQPDRPVLHSLPLLGALAAETARVRVGPLVARVSLLPNAVLVNALLTLQRLVGDRLLVTLGTGDRGNRDENLAYGVGFPPVADRVAALIACCRQLRATGVETWVGGASRAVRRAAALEADGWNGWGFDAATFAEQAADVRAVARDLPDPPSLGAGPEVGWGGQVLVGRTEEQLRDKLARHGDRPGLVSGTVGDLRRHFELLAEAGAAWAVCAPLDVGVDAGSLELLAEAASGIG